MPRQFLNVLIGQDVIAQARCAQQCGGSSPLTTKGDLYTRSSSADARLPVGTNGQVLTVDSAQTLGIKWATFGMTVREADGTPSFTASTIQFDQSGGFVVSNAGSGVASIGIQSATTLQAGIVDTGTQTFGGLKTFTGNLSIDTGSLIFKSGATANGSIYVMYGGSGDASFYLVTGGPSGNVADLFCKDIFATTLTLTSAVPGVNGIYADGIITCNQFYRCLTYDGVGASVLVTTPSGNKTLNFIGGIFVGVT